ncbi:MAG: toll/interleukin-1 receptor domain-containing protein [Candidatus Hodarchaeota archaeon]
MVDYRKPDEADIFISYNNADSDFSEKLVSRIEQESYQNRNLICFFAEWDIEPGENILLKIEKAIEKSRFIGIIMSPEWLKSDWTTLERVVPVYDDPAGLKGKIIPILRRDCEIPPSIRILKWLDFRTDSNFEREVKKLISRLKGEPYRSLLKREEQIPTSFDSTSPHVQDELLASNLFQVVELPNFFYRALSRVTKRDDVWKMLGEDVLVPVFALRDETKEIFSFSALNNPQQKLIQVVQNNTEKIPIFNLLKTERYPILIELVNRAMTAHMKNIGMVYDWKNKKTFFPLDDFNRDIRYATWKIGGREYTRFIVKKSNSGKYYIHRSCKATFTKIGDNLFLKVIPGWHFTTDGLFNPVPPKMMTSLSTKWMNIQRNHSILDDVRFWIQRLSLGNEYLELDVGADSPVIISSLPISSRIDHGIEEDYRERAWLEEEPVMDDLEVEIDEEELEELLDTDEEEDEIFE